MSDDRATAEHAAAPTNEHAIEHALDHVIVHVRDALATDARVGELGLDVAHVGDVIVVRGTVTNSARRACIVAVAEEVLHTHGFDVGVRDETELASTEAPTTAPEEL